MSADLRQRMRQEDRFGQVIFQMESQRMTIEHERDLLRSQLRSLADEVR